ncbi:hypothetical protein [Nocardioides sp.]|uniref:hypothetical protein n=1 Tax=Nocardioides sp. TaxID=35761 RepID=UPI0039E2F904
MSRIRAYVDEAVPRTGAAYLLTCALVADADISAVRDVLYAIRRPSERKVHWHDRLPKEHLSLASVVAGLAATHLIVVRDTDLDEPIERRRRKCLERLLWTLDQRGDVQQVVLEARQTRQNERDRKILDVMRASRVVGASLRMEHMPGPREPLLWIPDIVAGAYSDLLAGAEATFAPIADSVEVIVVG